MQVCPSEGQGVSWCLVCCVSLGYSCTPAVCRVAGGSVEERGACGRGGLGALEQVTLVVKMEEITISSPGGRRALKFLYFLYFFS